MPTAGHHISLTARAGKEGSESQLNSLLLTNLHSMCSRLLHFPNTIKTSTPRPPVTASPWALLLEAIVSTWSSGCDVLGTMAWHPREGG